MGLAKVCTRCGFGNFLQSDYCANCLKKFTSAENDKAGEIAFKRFVERALGGQNGE